MLRGGYFPPFSNLIYTVKEGPSPYESNDIEYDIELSKRAIPLAALTWVIIELLSLFLILKATRRTTNFTGKSSKVRGWLDIILFTLCISGLIVVGSYFFPLFHTLIKMGESLEGGFIDLSDIIFIIGFVILVLINLFTILSKFFIDRRSTTSEL